MHVLYLCEVRMCCALCTIQLYDARITYVVHGSGDTIRITSCIRVHVGTHPGTYNVPSGLYNPAYTYMVGLLKPHEVYLYVSVYIYT